MSKTEKNVVLENQKIQKMKNYHYISIPKAYIDTKLLSTSKKYNVILIERIQEQNEM